MSRVGVERRKEGKEAMTKRRGDLKDQPKNFSAFRKKKEEKRESEKKTEEEENRKGKGGRKSGGKSLWGDFEMRKERNLSKQGGNLSDLFERGEKNSKRVRQAADSVKRISQKITMGGGS